MNNNSCLFFLIVKIKTIYIFPSHFEYWCNRRFNLILFSINLSMRFFEQHFPVNSFIPIALFSITSQVVAADFLLSNNESLGRSPSGTNISIRSFIIPPIHSERMMASMVTSSSPRSQTDNRGEFWFKQN